MKAFALFIGLFFLGSQGVFAQNNSKSLPDGSYYICTMHPNIYNDMPGSCPIYGMDLVKAKPQKAKPKPQPTPPKKDEKHNETQPSAPPLIQEQQSPAPMPKDSVVAPALEKTEPAPPAPVLPKLSEIVVAPQQTVRYDLYIRDTTVNFTGKTRRALVVNGLPMPTLTFTEGNTALIYVHNELDEATSLHWHGLFLSDKEDGVPNLTQMPIKPKTTHVYTFPIIQDGTHWYHSHSGLQEQIGMYGSFIMKKRTGFRAGIDDLPEIPIVLSEWTEMNPDNVHRMLHNATDWFAIRKGTTQSYAEAIKQGYFKTKVTTEWKRMNAVDVSDVDYDRFLMNERNVGKSAVSKEATGAGCASRTAARPPIFG